MHGRVKVKTTAEKEAEKKKEKKELAKRYLEAKEQFNKLRNAFHSSSSTDQVTCTKLLGLTEKILVVNGDHAVAWNMRKAVLERLWDVPDVSCDLVKPELTLTEAVLLKSPKSYGAWYHRSWVVQEKRDVVDLSNEFSLTKLMLKADERNFHCWDYHRFIVSLSKQSPSEELAFTDELIEDNFSNYSAWHYRSSLLPTLFPADAASSGASLSTEKALEELSLVQNAAFTDPKDSSAWFYHQWVLGSLQKSQLSSVVGGGGGGLVALKQFPGNEKDEVLVVMEFSSAVDSQRASGVAGTPSIQVHSWNSSAKSNLWYAFIRKSSIKTSNLPGSVSASDWPENVKTVLIQELKNVEELLELEPDGKWPLLTSVNLMEAIDASKYLTAIRRNLSKLGEEVDSFRRSYYEFRDAQCFIAVALNGADTDGKLNIENQKIRGDSLPMDNRLAFLTCVNLSNNHLRSIRGFNVLLACQELLLDFNQLTDVNLLSQLPSLIKLSCRNNQIEEAARCSQVQAKAPKLVSDFEGNPFVMKRLEEFTV